MSAYTREAPSTGNNFVIRLVLGLLLLLPAIFVYREAQLLPALRTVEMSMQDVDIFRSDASEYVGNVNYEEMVSNPVFQQAVAYTLMVIGVRLLIVAVIPPLIGMLVGTQRQGGRLLNRIFLALVGVLFSPVILAVLWALFVSPMWGREPSTMTSLPDWMMLSSPEGARSSVIFVDALVTMAIAAAVGGVAFIAVMRGRLVSRFSGRAGIGVWLIGLLLTLASMPQTFDIPLILTNGGPGRATTTLALYFYDQAFRFMNMGAAAAQSTLYILLAGVVAFLIWLILAGLRLRLVYVSSRRARQESREERESSSLLSLISVPLLILIGLTSAALIVWGLWLAQTSQGFSDASAQVDMRNALMNTISGPWKAIWFIQLPVTYLAALSLGFLKPINRIVSHILFLILLVVAFFPPEALTLQWFMMGREAGLLNSPEMIGLAWRAGAFSLILFKLFFDGAAETFHAARESGQSTTDAFMRSVFLPSLPIFVLAGAVLSFVSAQSLLWPLIAVSERDMMALPVQIVMQRNMMIGAYLCSNLYPAACLCAGSSGDCGGSAD
jgi:ABC-type sugar transport system permease subunit